MKTSAKMAPTASVNAATGTPPETESTGAELDIVVGWLGKGEEVSLSRWRMRGLMVGR